MTITGRRPAPRPPAPRRHDYNPQSFYNAYSSAPAPTLRVFPGDSIRTHTVDGRGRGSDGKQIAPRSDPLIGPFYVEGAMPGDTLVVHLDRIRTNRGTAYQYDQIADSGLESGYLRNLNPARTGDHGMEDRRSGRHRHNCQSGVTGWAGYTVKLSPMLGCIGVAPPRDQVLRSEHLGPFGGNMDSREVREGATVYLPVFQPGALLYMGDGHAQQADGELTGQGLETSLDIQITVDLLPNTALGQPRIENLDSVMVVGTGATLDAALKNATTGMSRWLTGQLWVGAARECRVPGHSGAV